MPRSPPSSTSEAPPPPLGLPPRRSGHPCSQSDIPFGFTQLSTPPLTQCGFAKPQIRKTINNLLQLYWKDGWVFLEEGSYHVVLAKLLEEQAQQDQDSIEPAISSKVKGAQVRYIQELEHKVQVLQTETTTVSTVDNAAGLFELVGYFDSTSE